MNQEAQSNTRKRWLIAAVVIISLSLLGQFSAVLLPALNGKTPQANSLGGLTLWSGLLLTSIWALKGWKKLIGFVIGAIIGLAMHLSAIVVADYNSTKQTSIEDIERASNENLPAMVNDFTRLDSVSIDQDNKQYIIRMSIVNLSREEVDTEYLSEQFEQSTKPATCNLEEFTMFFSDGYTINYVYLDNTGESLITLRILPTDCGY